jgi:uncharacterized iron-regulated membrane protein
MNRILLRKIHRWVFIAVGIFMITQILSGLLMIMPPEWFGASPHWPRNPPADYHRAVLSPSDAVAKLTADTGSPVEIKQIKLRQIKEHLLYSIVQGDNSKKLIDAATGEYFDFTPELAESMIRNQFSIETPLTEIELLTEHSSVYPWGSLPAYRMTFDDSSSESYFVVQDDLKLYRSSPVTRARAAITSLHEFVPLELITHDSRVPKGLLGLVFGIALAGAITGMLMLLPRRKTKPLAQRINRN